jgi:rhamnosyl/mannosyltransferase
MRILHVYRTFFPDTQGGLEEVIRQICSGTGALGAECRVFTTTKSNDGPRDVEMPEARVVRIRESFEIASCNVALSAFSDFREQAEWADLIHYHFPWPFADVLNLYAPKQKRRVITYHSDIVRQKLLLKLYSPLMRRFLSSMDRIVCTSPNYFATSDTLSSFADKVEIIPIGLERATYPEVSDKELSEVRAKFGDNFFLFVGVLRYYKGLHLLLDAIQGAPFKVVIVGSGPTESQLQAQAKTLGVKNVVFAGQVNEKTKVALFQLSKCIVFPSYLRSEAFGVTLLEGAMFARPLISTEVGSGTSHVNVHDETGLVIAPGSAKALRKAMDQIHSRPEMAKLMGIRAERRFKRLFNGSLMASRYAQLYSTVLGQPVNAEKPINTKRA